MLSSSSEVILIVDDTPVNLHVISNVLMDEGFEVAIATSGEMLFKQLKLHLPDLILLDVQMPVMDGFEICQCLKNTEEYRNIPVIFMTSLVDVDSKAKGFQLGAVDYITKPFQELEVLARVRTHLQLRQLTKNLEKQIAQRTHDLELANQKLADYSQTLERSVEVRTQELSKTLMELQSMQQELIQSEKMSALGQLTASVAHEINNPLSVIRNAASNLVAAIQISLRQLPQLIQSLSPQQQVEFQSLVKNAISNYQALSTTEERQLRRQIQSELMLQGLNDAVELASKLSYMQIRENLCLYQSILQDARCYDILQMAYYLVLQHQSVDSIQSEVDRAAKIVFALKNYSHHSHEQDKSLTPIIDSIEVALTLYHSRLKQDIELYRYYEEVPPIFCNHDEMTQVWVNLIDNAIYAIGQQGKLEIHVFQQAEYIVVKIIDSGGGIPEDLQEQIFEPFFTTKSRGEGSGLGLDIVRQIVHKHLGEIFVHSQVGQTIFTVRLPLLLLEPRSP
ncbi:hybrid sensor histidine kinase/response regulator [Pseudanabaena yagii]|uniref:histidine kinase n=1 Tax=Pseudanabaena yagii GIHE-NHR1 TaxID=2722753 RepID=A0ABX1LT98_9CYAN|nr:response regulator [Pseudanabaena yagii]NMF58576.1 response regulator [Pseudanabaena yagii GIHE-NHR1]